MKILALLLCANISPAHADGWGDFGRVVVGVATGGASEAWRAVDEKLAKDRAAAADRARNEEAERQEAAIRAQQRQDTINGYLERRANNADEIVNKQAENVKLNASITAQWRAVRNVEKLQQYITTAVNKPEGMSATISGIRQIMARQSLAPAAARFVATGAYRIHGEFAKPRHGFS